MRGITVVESMRVGNCSELVPDSSWYVFWKVRGHTSASGISELPISEASNSVTPCVICFWDTVVLGTAVVAESSGDDVY
jgi:hypothetical protein